MNNILKLRKEKGLTRPALAQLSGVPMSTIHKLEIGTNDMRGAKADTLYKLAAALDTTVEYLLQYYLKPEIGTRYAEAELKCIVMLKNEWEQLEWKDTGLELLTEGMATILDVAEALGYKIFAKMNTLDYCFCKGKELVVLRGPGNVIMAKLPKTTADVRENDGVICNGCYSSLRSLDDLPK